MNVPKTEVYETFRKFVAFAGVSGAPATEWRYRVKAGNGEILCQSEAYTTKADAERGLRALRRALLPGTREPEAYTAEETKTMLAVAWFEGARYMNGNGQATPEELSRENPYT